MKLRYDIMWQPFLVGIGAAIINFVLHLIFIAPVQRFGIIFSIIFLVISIGQIFLLAEIRMYYVRKHEERNRDKPPMTEEEQIEKYGGRVVLSFEELEGFGNAMTIFLIISFIYAVCFLVIPSNLIPSGVRLEDIPIYQLIDYEEFVFQLMHVIILPGINILVVLFGSTGLSWG